VGIRGGEIKTFEERFEVSKLKCNTGLIVFNSSSEVKNNRGLAFLNLNLSQRHHFSQYNQFPMYKTCVFLKNNNNLGLFIFYSIYLFL